MSGTFASFNTALSALRYQQTALDTASSNIANSSTAGYVRRRAEAETIGASTQPALWSRSGVGGESVGLAGINRLTDALLDARVRAEHGKQSYLDTRVAVLERVESGIGEPGDTGVSAAIIDFKGAWQDLANSPSNEASRGQVLAQGAALADAVQQQARMLEAEMGDDRARLTAMVDEVSTLAGDLAATNSSIAIAKVNGTDAGVLLDKRDQLALRLSQLTGASATQRSDGGFDVSVGGVALVSGDRAGTFSVVSGIGPGGTGAPPVVLGVTPPGGAAATAVSTSGATGAMVEVLSTTLPAYASELDAVARQLADAVNAQHTAAYDATGTPGQAFFAYDPADPAGSLRVAITSASQVAASAVPGGGRDGSAADTISRSFVAAEASYSRLVNSFGTTVASAGRLATTQRTLTGQVDGAREQLAGVSLDEEMVAMVAAQRAYEAAARLMTTVDSVLDTLINRTGLTR
ncbi:MAG TPA: flagellar hook-associated protein FlgK [Nocardioides sp.]